MKINTNGDRRGNYSIFLYMYVHIIYKTFQLVFRILCRMGLSDIRTCPLPLTSEVKIGKSGIIESAFMFEKFYFNVVQGFALTPILG